MIPNSSSQSGAQHPIIFSSVCKSGESFLKWCSIIIITAHSNCFKYTQRQEIQCFWLILFTKTSFLLFERVYFFSVFFFKTWLCVWSFLSKSGFLGFLPPSAQSEDAYRHVWSQRFDSWIYGNRELLEERSKIKKDWSGMHVPLCVMAWKCISRP